MVLDFILFKVFHVAIRPGSGRVHMLVYVGPWPHMCTNIQWPAVMTTSSELGKTWQVMMVSSGELCDECRLWEKLPSGGVPPSVLNI